jgi:hypothetical protein
VRVQLLNAAAKHAMKMRLLPAPLLVAVLLAAHASASSAGPYAGHCSPLWPGHPKDPGCWAWDWQFSFHPVTTSSPTVGDSSGGLHINGSWHFFYSCTGGWCHLETDDLVDYESHGIIVPKQSPGYPHPLGLGTGSVTAAADGSGDILAYCNNVNGHMRSSDGMKTWTAFATTTSNSPGGRDQARPLQSSDGTWFQVRTHLTCGRHTPTDTETAAWNCVSRATATWLLTCRRADDGLQRQTQGERRGGLPLQSAR